MSYEPSENFWKTLYTKEDMMNKIVWGANNETEFNKDTATEGDRIIKALGLDKEKEQKIVLDFGCGIGRLSKYVATKTPHKVLGVDVSQPMTNQARLYCAGTNTAFHPMLNGHELPVSEGVVDFIFSHIVLQHVNKYKVYYILKEMRRVMKKEALGFVQLPNMAECMHQYDAYANGYVSFNEVQISAMHLWLEEEVRLVLGKAGFGDISVAKEGTDLYVLFKK